MSTTVSAIQFIAALGLKKSEKPRWCRRGGDLAEGLAPLARRQVVLGQPHQRGRGLVAGLRDHRGRSGPAPRRPRRRPLWVPGSPRPNRRPLAGWSRSRPSSRPPFTLGSALPDRTVVPRLRGLAGVRHRHGPGRQPTPARPAETPPVGPWPRSGAFGADQFTVAFVGQLAAVVHQEAARATELVGLHRHHPDGQLLVHQSAPGSSKASEASVSSTSTLPDCESTRRDFSSSMLSSPSSTSSRRGAS